MLSLNQHSSVPGQEASLTGREEHLEGVGGGDRRNWEDLQLLGLRGSCEVPTMHSALTQGASAWECCW